MNKTQEIIISMLTENTGRAMCDSGDYYGRNWQANQGVDFDSQPEVRFDFFVRDDKKTVSAGDLSVVISLYHYLLDRATFSEKMDRKFHKWCKITDPTKEFHWLQLMEKFADDMQVKYPAQMGNIYDSSGNPFTVNSYNGECALSQTIQFVQFSLDETHYVLLQIHGGCDVRGGYTKPRVFEVNEYFMDWNNISIASEDNEHTWDSDDGYHFQYVERYDDSQLTLDGSRNIVKHKNLETFELRTDGESLFCPISGKKLKAYFMST